MKREAKSLAAYLEWRVTLRVRDSMASHHFTCPRWAPGGHQSYRELVLSMFREFLRSLLPQAETVLKTSSARVLHERQQSAKSRSPWKAGVVLKIAHSDAGDYE